MASEGRVSDGSAFFFEKTNRSSPRQAAENLRSLIGIEPFLLLRAYPVQAAGNVVAADSEDERTQESDVPQNVP